MRSETASRPTTLYSRHMTLEYTKASFTAVWALGICAIGLAADVTFTSGQIVLATVAVLPPLAMWRLWTTPPATMSGIIRKAIR